jgi:hypothetical protein
VTDRTGLLRPGAFSGGSDDEQISRNVAECTVLLIQRN